MVTTIVFSCDTTCSASSDIDNSDSGDRPQLSSSAQENDLQLVRLHSFVLCGQKSSLLWTPALRPKYRSNAPAQGEKGKW